ncbi:MAG TPA: DUF1992 domain-containing protein [Symbiobacteriaceae bacterium]|jgi:hypothetical protein|nr:DUF1992 domain-containing protein [Symbiobacteriaceae bacterium]
MPISRNEQKTVAGLSRQDLNETIAGSPGKLDHWMDEIIREAQQRGDFDDLPGKGRPLSLHDSDPYGGLEADVYKVLKNAGFAPEWVELRKQIVAEINWLREHGNHPERPSRIVETNVLIDKHNRAVPNAQLTLPKLPRNFGLPTP